MVITPKKDTISRAIQVHDYWNEGQVKNVPSNFEFSQIVHMENYKPTRLGFLGTVDQTTERYIW